MWDSLRKGGESTSLAKDHTINTLLTQKQCDQDFGTTTKGFEVEILAPALTEEKLEPEGPSWREPLSSRRPALGVSLL